MHKTTRRPSMLLGASRAAILALCLVPVALTAAGCAKAKAASVQDGPPLTVPAAPPRVLAPVDEPLAEAPPPPEQPTPQPAGTGRQPTARPAQPARRNPPTATAPAPAPEPPPPDTASQSPPVTDQPAAPRAVPTPADAAAERGVRDKLRKAAADLSGVNYQRLSTEGKAQYDQSKRFSDSAEMELQKRNYSLAATMADKAAELATQLLASR